MIGVDAVGCEQRLRDSDDKRVPGPELFELADRRRGERDRFLDGLTDGLLPLIGRSNADNSHLAIEALRSLVVRENVRPYLVLNLAGTRTFPT